MLGFNARTTIFQLYSGEHEHEAGDKMNMKSVICTVSRNSSQEICPCIDFIGNNFSKSLQQISIYKYIDQYRLMRHNFQAISIYSFWIDGFCIKNFLLRIKDREIRHTRQRTWKKKTKQTNKQNNMYKEQTDFTKNWDHGPGASVG